MKRHNKDLGNLGEKYAVEFLAEKGYRILKMNYTCKVGEVDIIARDGEYIVFVEVKTRETCQFGRPAEAVTMPKQRKIIKTASWYMMKHPDTCARFDIIEILGELVCGDMLNVDEINHIENAFYAG
ncbi:UPF0102 protein [Clostridia bacterium]|nr:UPF0102 protein [Clostridia bacterium]